MPDAEVVAEMDGLTPAQRDAARATGAVAVLAGAGTGKTRTLVAGVVDRIVRRGMSPQRILAVTFTNKAAGEMRMRISAALGPESTPYWIGTFHGHGRRMLRRDPDIAGLREGFDIADSDDSMRIVRRLLQRATDEGVIDHEDGDIFRRRVKAVTNRIAGLKDELVLPEQSGHAAEGMIASRGLSHPDDLMALRMAAALYPAYQAALREANMADFGDLLLWPTVMMRRDEAYRREWAARFDAVLADEFQDVNRMQFLWLRALSQDHGELFAVGDDAQSIYGWRGANVGIIRNFLRDFPGGRMIALEQNFRSTGHILAAANAIISQERDRLPKKLFTAAGDGDPIELVDFPGSVEEARGIAAEIGRRALEGVPYDDMAVLYRFNFMSRLVEEELLRSRVPYELVNDTAFWQRGPVKDALAFLRLASCPDGFQSDEAFRRVVNLPARGIGAKRLAALELVAETDAISLFRAAEQYVATTSGKATDKLRGFLATIRHEAERADLTIAERLHSLIVETGYQDMYRAAGEDGRVALENLAELVDLAAEFSALDELLDHAALGSVAASDTPTGRVKLMTVHGAKGLEFGHVFLIGWERGLFPSTSNTDPDEELRLAYVALTRARRRAVISWCGYRNGRSSAASPFIGDIPATALHRGWLRRARMSDAAAR
ncbi:ATP-dependent helicase [Gluconacetobacter diazotrophicus]|uniref:DNA 3'-5' helicase n=1 Tax=Gluconacetobacter diazotrophicus TaxID=33996 RepID=A0A7W4I6W5_GLUDI|nr:ATP-dependent helicase [Gluconacetobacter diazotrophicus]MBB2157366.1 ATP-dependent helicase [Gluconacetobacter diazotrophicus]